MQRILFGLALAGWWVFGPALAVAEGQEAKKPAVAKQVLDVAKFDLNKALDMAQKKVLDGKPLAVRTEVQQGEPRFGVYFLDGDKIREVELNAVSGEMAKNKELEKFKGQTPAEIRKMLDNEKVSLKDAIARSTTEVKNGKPFEAELELKSGKPVVEVEILDAGKITRVRIDPVDASKINILKPKQ
jgi:uncharacterized membrane protein YkoI